MQKKRYAQTGGPELVEGLRLLEEFRTIDWVEIRKSLVKFDLKELV